MIHTLIINTCFHFKSNKGCISRLQYIMGSFWKMCILKKRNVCTVVKKSTWLSSIPFLSTVLLYVRILITLGSYVVPSCCFGFVLRILVALHLAATVSAVMRHTGLKCWTLRVCPVLGQGWSVGGVGVLSRGVIGVVERSPLCSTCFLLFYSSGGW